MGINKTILLAGAFALSAFAAPIPNCEAQVANQAPALTAEIITTIAPATASCNGSEFADECADATRAAPAISKSFETYGITTAGEQAALVAYMLFESGNFKYSKNHYPGRPGQGTRMMAMPPFISEYATAVVGAQAVATASAEGPAAVLNLVNADDEKSFGSAAWYLSTKCTPEIRSGLAAETVDGWHNFLTVCVGTTAVPERDTSWVAAKQAILGY
jgi:hypothetical protein